MMRDEMEIFNYNYKNRKFSYRVLDANIKHIGKEKYSFFISIDEENSKNFTVNFVLHSDCMGECHSEIEKRIRKYVDEQGE